MGVVAHSTRAVGCFVVAFAALLWGAQAHASNITFVGNVGYSYAGNSAVLTADRIQNKETGGFSGTLRLELWAFPSPYVGISEIGYKLAEHTLGTLNAGFGLPNVNTGSIAFLAPPNGNWVFTMIVTEFTGTSVNDGYAVRDYVNFSGTVTFGPPPAPLVPSF